MKSGQWKGPTPAMRNFMKGDPLQAEIPLTDIIMTGDRRIDESGDSNPALRPGLPISGNSESWRILLIELVHMLALFFTHACHARRARVTAVMFDQIMRRLDILDKMPGHEQGLIIRRIGHAETTDIGTPDYFMLFGDLAFCGAEAFSREHVELKRPAQLSRSLDQAFACFHNHGIHALYLQFPPKTAEKIDQLQLALNIVARFHRAVANNASITFRYFGHALTIPLIHDTNGRPDPNLTILAGLNGLSALNMRKVILQADAFHKMSRANASDDQQLDNYNSIFRLPSLRSQLIKPLLEINNLPWIPMEVPARTAETPAEPVRAAAPLPVETTPAPDLHTDRSDSRVEDAVAALFDPDFSGQKSAQGLGQLLGALSGMLRTLDTTDPSSMERVLGFLHGRLEQLPEDLLSQLELRRQGIKINYEGRSILLGMVHPRLLHLITLIKEQLATCKKREAIDACFQDLRQCDQGHISERFDLTAMDTDAILELLKSCLNIGAVFDHAKCLHHLDALADYGNTAFEMLWCFLPHMPNDQERLQMLNILALLAMRVENRVPLSSFLLSDLMRNPDSLQDSDREAFTLAGHMLRTEKAQDRIDSEGTPESVLALRGELDENLRRHIAWRLDIEQARILAKFDTIRKNAARALQRDAASTDPDGPAQLHELLFLEREGLLFLSLAQGETARAVMRAALAFYGDPGSAIYQCRMKTTDLSALMGHLAVLLKAMARLGQPGDIKRLTALEQSASRFMAMDTDSAHKRRVKQTLQWVAPAIRSIQVQWKKM
jgi:hypothetical protein